jgi:hypothetical protein
MPSELKWAPEEDQLLLSFVDGQKVVNCNEAAKLMNEQAPLLGIDIRTYIADDLQKRLHFLLQPRYRYLLPPMKVRDASDFNLALKGNQLNSVQTDANPVQPPDSSAEPEGHSTVSPQGRDQHTEKKEYAKLERYGEPELYADLFPQLDADCEVHEGNDLF